MSDPISYIKSSGGDVNASIVDQGGYAEALLRSTVQVFEGDFPHGGTTSDIVLIAGVTVVVSVQEYTSSGSVSVFVDGHSDDSILLYDKSRSEFTPQNSGAMRVWNNAETTTYMRILVYTDPKYEVGMNFDKIMPQITTRIVMDSLVKYEGKNVPHNVGVSVDTLEDKLVDSDVGDASEPVLIRDSSGQLLYDLRWIGVVVNNAGIIALFDVNGVLIDVYNKTEVEDGILETEKRAYYAVFIEYSNYPSAKWVAMNVGDDDGESINTYRVGQGGDWETFTDMLVYLADDSTEKTVIVEGGVYDIYEEMGGNALIASIDNPSSLNWRDVCHVVPDNTTIIGEGRVTLRWMPSAEAIGSSDMAFLFSPLNVSGTCRIENIDIECQNCRYGIHDETSSQGQWDGTVHVFKNVRVKNHHGSYGDGRAYCAGHNRNMRLEFVDCEFDSSDGSLNAWSTHFDNQNQYGMSTFNFLGCKFLIGSSGEAVRFSGKNDTDNEVCMDEVKFNSCYIGGGKVRFSDENYGSDQPQHDSGYRVQLIGCNQVEAMYDSNINEGVFEQYNTIGDQQ